MFDTIKTKAKDKMKGNMLEFWGIMLVIGLISTVLSELPRFFGVKLTETRVLLGIEYEVSTPAGSTWTAIVALFMTIFSVALVYWVLSILKEKKVDIKEAIKFAFKHILTILVVSFLVGLAISLGLLLLIVPGIIISLGLSMVYPIICDNPDIGIMDAISKSWELMKGHKWEYFTFLFTFIGWILLCILIIPVFYVIPYITFAELGYYLKLTEK